MKATIRFSLSVISFFFISFVSCDTGNKTETASAGTTDACCPTEQGSANDQDIEAQNIRMLQEFYSKYDAELEKEQNYSEEVLDGIKQQYCTKKLLERLRADLDSGYIDADPFINAQDTDGHMMETLRIVKVPKEKDIYEASYRWADDSTKITIRYQLVKEGSTYKIGDVL
ncbi:DUF3828 domain-containing protein [Chitinophaga agri]|uniref:DUF3828 domain-containing protein n=1 Tax=Chitinophaga agri TaxID=2703787 RepID=A0A6B9ZLA6_9BACT|nr:DUF3828 domain-containing protein [Chitinophaga agri]QHS63210.1 DUF3828 domain-containing protein [Chitinophaga agri]